MPRTLCSLVRTIRPALPRAGFLVLWGLALTGCETPAVTGETNPVPPIQSSTAQLRAGDSITIALLGVPDASTNTLQIEEQGQIRLPYIGAVPVAGLTAAELSQRIRQTYIERKIYTALDVSVAVTERYVYVGGEVVHPGRIIWSSDLTVTKAIQAAGGFTLYAKETKVALVRDRITYEISVPVAQRQPAQDPQLAPGDSLQVPRSPF